MKNYYEVLEVSQTASNEVIEKAYKILAKKYHPDAQKEGVSDYKFKQIQEAYETLSDSEKRQTYDFNLKESSKNKDKQFANSSIRTNNKFLF